MSRINSTRRWRTSQNLAPFDDEELAAALGQAGIDRQELSEPLLALVRKPRYFELAVRH